MICNIFKFKSRLSNSSKVSWMVETDNGYWGSYPTLKRAMNEVRWANGKSVRRSDLDFSK